MNTQATTNHSPIEAELYTRANGSMMHSVTYEAGTDSATIADDLREFNCAWDYAILSYVDTGDVLGVVFREQVGQTLHGAERVHAVIDMLCRVYALDLDGLAASLGIDFAMLERAYAASTLDDVSTGVIMPITRETGISAAWLIA